MGPGAMGPLAMGPDAMGRVCGGALWGLCRGAAAALGSPRFPRVHAVGLGALVGLGPLLRLRAQPHSVFASPHNLLEARLISSAGGWTSLFLASLLVASLPLLRPPPAFLLRLIGRWLVGVALWSSAPRLLSLVEGALGRCVQPMAAGLLLLPHGSPTPCRASGGQWEGPLVSRQAFSLVYCALGLAEEAGLMGRALYGDWPGRGQEGRGLEEARWEGPSGRCWA
ncbi:fat storage-inducing transmembrane protein 1-like [Patagioenas fasciata]|uniref:fat storage-inducing transmembrane protein 1-like n=1 Tax=Patagioenas fasciata TaxID=372321 RepID=UPI0032E8EB11